jgi:hypothetical protein
MAAWPNAQTGDVGELSPEEDPEEPTLKGRGDRCMETDLQMQTQTHSSSRMSGPDGGSPSGIASSGPPESGHCESGPVVWLLTDKSPIRQRNVHALQSMIKVQGRVSLARGVGT